MNKEQLALKLYDIGAVKVGHFMLKSGIVSPIYIDLRILASYPEVLEEVASYMWEEANSLQVDLLCGVPLAALPIATAIALKYQQPMLMCRKQVKEYGTKKSIEGSFKAGQSCLLVEDLVTSGVSSWEVIQQLEKEDLKVSDVLVLVDREQGAREYLKDKGYTVHSVFTLSALLAILVRARRIDTATSEQVSKYLATACAPKFVGRVPKEPLTYGQRAQLCKNQIGKKLFTWMEEKQTNLCVAADVTTKEQLLWLADQLGPEIAMFKTHVDIIEDWDVDLGMQLQALAQKHQFVLIEDRKFADIGATVQKQFGGGVYRIADWADGVISHSVTGPGVIEGLKSVKSDVAIFLLAECSAAGSLATGEYTQETLKIAEQYPENVIGLIAGKKLTDNPWMIHATPGVKLQQGTDQLRQQYSTPEMVIGDRWSDLVIVGRGIVQAEDPKAAAQQYRKIAWSAYEARINWIGGAAAVQKEL